MNQSQVVQELFKKYFLDISTVGVEIGTKCADLTVAILDVLPHCLLYTIDPWEHRDKAEFEAGEPQEYHDRNKVHAMNRLQKYMDERRVVVFPCKSEECVQYIHRIKLDFVWIDGDHSEGGLTKDLNLYYPLVKPGGIFGGHDYGQCHPLTEIIKERFGDRIITGDDFTWWVIK